MKVQTDKPIQAAEPDERAQAILGAFGMKVGGVYSGTAYGGQFAAHPKGPRLQSHDPSTGAVLAEIETAAPDDMAWERAHRHYTSMFADKGYSDIQEQTPLAIEELETCIS